MHLGPVNEGEVARRNDSELAGLCSLFNLAVIVRGQPGGAHDHADTFVQAARMWSLTISGAV